MRGAVVAGWALVSEKKASGPSRRSPALRAAVEDQRSTALPWAARPRGLDDLREATNEYRSSLCAGDFGFDPLGCADVGWGLNAGETAEDRLDRVYAYREAELKHGRLAMVAVVGWPLAELYDAPIAARFGLENELVAPDALGIGLAPSVLNGGLGKIPVLYWVAVVAVSATVESIGRQRLDASVRAATTRAPGDFGFDPLSLFPQDDGALSLDESTRRLDLAEALDRAQLLDRATADVDDQPLVIRPMKKTKEEEAKDAPMTALELRRLRIQEQELTHGRTAMLAITGFVGQEFLTKVPVVEATPQFFIPDAGELQAVAGFEEVGAASLNVLVETFKAILDAAQNP